MLLSRHITILSGAGILSWIGWVVVLYKFDPLTETDLGLKLALFFISLALALTSTFTIIGFYFRLWLIKNETPSLNIALRQGILLTIITTGCLIFQLLKVLSWWSGLLFIGATTLIEFYFMSKEQ